MINVMYIFIFVNWDTLVPWVYQLCCLPSINNTIPGRIANKIGPYLMPTFVSIYLHVASSEPNH